MIRAPFVAILLLLSGCTSANIGPNARANQTQRLDLEGVNYDQAFRAAAQAAATMKWSIKSSDMDTGIISASYEGGLSRWGDEVNVMVSETPAGSRVIVRSNLGQSPNRKHVAEYLDAIRSAVE